MKPCKEIYYTLYDAECAACTYASDHDGLVVGTDMETEGMYPLRGTVEPVHADFTDYRFVRNTENGPLPEELQAVRVISKETGEDIGLFGYLEDMID